MKNRFNLIALLLIVSGALVFVSCSNNDEDGDPQSPIVGTWTYESADISITIEGQDFLDYLIEAFGLTQAQAEEFEADFEDTMNDFDGMSWSFTKDGKFTVTSPEGNETGTWSLSSDNTKLSLTSDGDTEVIDVKSLTSSKMELTYEETFEDDMDEDGENEELEISMLLGLKK